MCNHTNIIIYYRLLAIQNAHQKLQHSLVSDDGPALGHPRHARHTQMQILLTIHFPLAFSSCFADVFVSPHCTVAMLTVFLLISLLIAFVIVVAFLSFCLILCAYQIILLIAGNSGFLFGCAIIIVFVVVFLVSVCVVVSMYMLFVFYALLPLRERQSLQRICTLCSRSYFVRIIISTTRFGSVRCWRSSRNGEGTGGMSTRPVAWGSRVFMFLVVADVVKA